jgi:hypothetical protein
MFITIQDVVGYAINFNAISFLSVRVLTALTLRIKVIQG